MSTTTTTVHTLPPATQPVLRLRLNGTDKKHGDFRDDLARDGYAVIKAIPEERAKEYVEKMHAWLESFDMGYKRGDPSTIKVDKLPLINEKGMCMHYGVTHEDFVWSIRSEPGVIDVFAKVYGTDHLLVSFDAVNATFPGRDDLPENVPWAHQDQHPDRDGFRVLQGLVNLLPNGENDGGLMVMPGAHLLSAEYHEYMRQQGEVRIPSWTPEWYGFPPAGLAWLKEKGFKWTKVNAEAGDLIVWDSRAPHYNVSPTGTRERLATYTCYMPVSDATEADLVRKAEAFEKRLGTTHWPNAKHTGNNAAMRNGSHHGPERARPLNEPVLSERAYKLTGIPYIGKGVAVGGV